MRVFFVQGMARDCRVKLHASVSYELLQDVIFLIPEIHDYQNIKLYQEVRGSQYYKLVSSDDWRVSNCWKNDRCEYPFSLLYRVPQASTDRDSEIDSTFW